MLTAETLIFDLRNKNILKTEIKKIPRNQFLIQAGERERYFYLVLSGAFRVFYLPNIRSGKAEQNEEHTIRFGYQNSIITALKSFLTGQPTELYIQAIRTSEIMTIRREDFLELVNNNPDRNHQYRLLLEQLVVQQMEREMDLLCQSPAERYRRVWERSPQLFQEVPLKHIAHYLRMTPETLSRIRKNS